MEQAAHRKARHARRSHRRHSRETGQLAAAAEFGSERAIRQGESESRRGEARQALVRERMGLDQERGGVGAVVPRRRDRRLLRSDRRSLRRLVGGAQDTARLVATRGSRDPRGDHRRAVRLGGADQHRHRCRPVHGGLLRLSGGHDAGAVTVRARQAVRKGAVQCRARVRRRRSRRRQLAAVHAVGGHHPASDPTRRRSW